MHTVTVIKNVPHAPNLHSIQFTKPQGFTYIPGQFIVMQSAIQGKLIRRSYSLSSSPNEEFLQILVRAQEHGKFSPILCQAKEGQTFTILGPFGLFTPESTYNVICIAAGTGIAPFRSFSLTYPENNCTILYSVRTKNDLAYYGELEESTGKIVATLTREEKAPNHMQVGRIHKELLTEHIVPESYYYVCGSTPMVVAVVDMLLDLGIDKKYIRTEKYGNIS